MTSPSPARAAMGNGPLGRIIAILAKEFIQMRRDRLTFAIMFAMPIVQLILFGYAINTDPKRLPTAVHLEEQTPITRALIAGLENSGYFRIVGRSDDPAEAARLLERGRASFVVHIPAGFTERLVRGERPQLLVEADASDPVASSNAMGRLERILATSTRRELTGPLGGLAARPPAIELVAHARYNPEGVTQYNIVPGLLGVILTMTMVMITAMAMTREVERGTLENLLAMPAKPLEVMMGKIAPYVLVGLGQTAVVLGVAKYLFGVPFAGPLAALLLGVAVFIVANLAVGFTFSTVARTQLQAMQMTFFFFLPSILLSGFMFPFRGMPDWAQAIGQALPLTHFLRIVRGVMLKGAGVDAILPELGAIAAFTLVAAAIAMLRYRRTLD